MITTYEKQAIDDRVAQALPSEWFVGPATVTVDDDEMLIVGTLGPASPGRGDPSAFRELTRTPRMEIAYALAVDAVRTVSWGVNVHDTTVVFTSLAVPVMTRLRIGEREVLDTLVGAGVARSRSEALAWCARFVAQREVTWLGELRQSLESVAKVRGEGPSIA